MNIVLFVLLGPFVAELRSEFVDVHDPIFGLRGGDEIEMKGGGFIILTYQQRSQRSSKGPNILVNAKRLLKAI